MRKFILLMALLSILSFGVMATPQLTINTATWGEDTRVNISTKSTNDGSQVNMTYITVRFSASNTANSSTINVVNITNSTATNFDFGYGNFSFSTLYQLEDTAVGSATAISTGVAGADAVSSSAVTINVERSAPAAPTTAHAAGKEFKDANVVTYTVAGANTTSCRIAFGRTSFSGSNTFAMTHSGSSCTYTVSKATIADGSYKTYVQASDGTNTSVSAGRDFKITTIEGATSDDIGALSVPAVEKAKQDVQLGAIITVIIIATVIYMAFFRKK